MFTGFTQSTQSFFWDLQFNNERPWFQAHKEEFELCLNRPFRELANDCFALVDESFPLSGLEVHISRIYRDARRLYGRGPYKDNLWFSIKNRSNGYEGPSFFFEINPAFWCYGLGCYFERAEGTERFRRAVDANPAAFQRLAADAAGMEGFCVEGPEYKRPKGDYSPEINAWYNRKHAHVICRHDYDELLLSESLPGRIAEDFISLMPLYDYFRSIT